MTITAHSADDSGLLVTTSSSSSPAPPSFPTASVPKRKLGGYDFYREVLKSPVHVVAPMVDQSELAWRRLSRKYGAQVIYTPMINAKIFANDPNGLYRSANFDIASGEEGDPATDRPLIVQFCANDAAQLLKSARIIEPYCDAIDINLGCPQEIARKGHYGSFLQDDWELIYDMINTLHTNLSIPVTAKFRVFPSVEKTVEYAKMLERAGAQILTCHGRIREQRAQSTGLADWDKIRAVKQAVSVPVFANGNILFQEDIGACLIATGADGVMSAEAHLYNPALFMGRPAFPLPTPVPTTPTTPTPASPSDEHNKVDSDFDYATADDAAILARHPPHADLALEYLAIVNTLTTRTTLSGVKGHLFKLMRPALAIEIDLREWLGRVRAERLAKPRVVAAAGGSGEGNSWGLEEYEDVCREMKRRMDLEIEKHKGTPLRELITVEPRTGLRLLPHWLAQPYFRPLPVQTANKPEKVPSTRKGASTATTAPLGPGGPTGIKRVHDEQEDEVVDGGDDAKRMRLENSAAATAALIG